MNDNTNNSFIDRIEKLNQIGISLSAEKDINKILETILMGAKHLTYADGGTIYLLNKNKELEFEVLCTSSLNIRMGGSTGKKITFPPIPLYTADGEPNNDMVVTHTILNDSTINIPDAYNEKSFDLSGTYEFDKKTGYHSKSFLTVPMKDHANEFIGVLQLLNATDPATDCVKAFSEEDQQLVESLASQAAVSITNQRLLQEQKTLFDSFINLLAVAIDEKSPYNGGHCKRVPELTMMLAEACNQSDNDYLKQFSLSEDDRYELEIAAWLHDCGKITTPEYVVDKSTKLETIYDRIHTIDTRFVALKNEYEINYLKQKIVACENGRKEQSLVLEKEYHRKVKKLEEDREFIRVANVGGEFMSPSHQERVQDISQYQWTNVDGKKENFLNENEIKNLLIPRGTLTEEERNVINNHIVMTIKMLESLPFPKHLKNVSEYAGGHHERMDGKGYPKGLTREQMSIQARIMAIADIFEALTASDRPYKKAKTLSESLFILGKMKQNQHIDPDLFKVFIDQKIYLSYGEKFLGPEQIDEVIKEDIPGYLD
jgi:HD-GYP domain-containing protein (c-di-GMP phosphodiesterase class II)